MDSLQRPIGFDSEWLDLKGPDTLHIEIANTVNACRGVVEEMEEEKGVEGYY